jgi:DNA segregation ATPase FtsK/SpoIIIE-like protein
MSRTPRELVLRLSSSKPMDFRAFMDTPHAAGHKMATDPLEARQLADALVVEMERRYALIESARCDNLAEYNAENPSRAEPYLVAVFDEYAEMVASFAEKQDRDSFETAVGRLAQKARAAGIHLVVCMQRPDANALKGAIKANILHRFALKLPQNQDSRIILDDGGAETLLGQGDLLYKDGNNKLQRLQVPFLDNSTLKRTLAEIVARNAPSATAQPANAAGRTPASEPSREDLAFVAAFLQDVLRIEAKPAEWHRPQPTNGETAQIPHLVYAPEVDRLRDAIFEHHLLLADFDWPAWKEAEQFLDAARIRSATLQDLRQLLTLHVRKERFNEGHLADVISRGHIAAVLRRLGELAGGR